MKNIGNAQIIGKRDNQEDYFASLKVDDGILAIVADGMGGYEGGEIASQLSVKSFIQFFTKNFDIDDINGVLLKSIYHINAKIEEKRDKNPLLDEMGNTIVAVYLTSTTLYWISVGDSILYKYSEGSLIRVNADHSIAGDLQKLVKIGTLTQKEADQKPNRHALTSAITGYQIPFIENSSLKITNSDRFIIASDGIHTLANKQIETILLDIENNQNSADKIIELIQKKDLKNQDNTTLIILQTEKLILNSSKTEIKNSKRRILLISTIIFLLGVIMFVLFLL